MTSCLHGLAQAPGTPGDWAGEAGPVGSPGFDWTGLIQQGMRFTTDILKLRPGTYSTGPTGTTYRAPGGAGAFGFPPNPFLASSGTSWILLGAAGLAALLILSSMRGRR